MNRPRLAMERYMLIRLAIIARREGLGVTNKQVYRIFKGGESAAEAARA